MSVSRENFDFSPNLITFLKFLFVFSRVLAFDTAHVVQGLLNTKVGRPSEKCLSLLAFKDLPFNTFSVLYPCSKNEGTRGIPKLV